MSIPINIPLINPNEPEALVVAVHVNEGQHISQGALLATLETTKSTNDLAAESSGYIVGLQVTQGQFVRAGDLFAFIADSMDWTPPQVENPRISKAGKASDYFAGLRITQPARALAEEFEIRLEDLPGDRLITESIVRKLIQDQGSPKIDRKATQSFDPGSVIIYGGGGHGKTVIDMLRTLQTYVIVGIIDDGIEVEREIMGLPVLGGSEQLHSLYIKGIRQAVNAVGGIGNITVRIEIFDKLDASGFSFPSLVHPSAVVEPSAVIDAGAQVFSRAYVGSEAHVGFGCIVNTGAIISHDCSLGKYSNISPGAILAGGVSVGEGALIGMGVTINLQVRVGAGARIGNGATVKADVPEKGIIRAGAVWP